ncbi:MAG TPA: hypothetical protein ENI44_03200, partial [Thermoplasmatales archaeon]|nr:hypothetical protein [Thermoplasmatales archaeon]
MFDSSYQESFIPIIIISQYMSFRGFIAIDIKPTDEIKKFLEDLDKTKAKLKLVELENMHITLKFLGETQEEHIDKIIEIIENSIGNIKP